MNKIIYFITAALLCAATAGCRHTASPAADSDTYEYTDDYGSVVNVPTHPRRVVSLSPAVTEIMFALGADSLLVGRTEFCVYPPEAARVENIGGISNLNVEKVLSVAPDLIISGSMVPQKTVKQFEDMGVPMVCVIEKQHFDGLYENISKIGHLAGCQPSADSLVRVLKSQMATVAGRDTILPQSTTSRPTVYYVVGFGSGGNFTAGGNTFINDIITMAGGRNIAEQSEGWTFSVEALMDADPDFILIRAEDSARFCQTSPYSQLSAVKEGRTVALEDGILDLQVPRNIEVIRRLKARFATKQP